ncbi:MAG TPA: Asp-tRNA(Asn)/Glu-tRNA(Gln) amidotransferase subunit GatB [Polyangia bacterium]|nr:Asp-tRNA(Asn)/Glu-tRNA(Gln) amidotransferase subunit GatB [Polyangia bacterium]
MTWEPVIGLECHVQLATATKAFSTASAAFGAAPNTHDDPYTLALPGTLPVLSRAAIEFAIKLGLATGCAIRPLSRFARKHYFYPDLPKGFQISQYDEPLCEHGRVDFVLDGPDGKEVRSVRLTRIHVEEDAGKNVHVPGAPVSLVDYNRAGVPLCEVVSEPDVKSPAEAGAYLRAIRQLVRYLGISDGNMEEGSLRCDANVSVRRAGEPLGTRTELKNINSFKNVEEAIEFEIARQIELLERGERVVQETRLWNPDKKQSAPMRSKEHAHDYRYFPEPDLPPLRVDDAWREAIRASLPELPIAKRTRFIQALGLSPYDADVLTAEKKTADFFEEVIARGAPAKAAANWITGEVMMRSNRGDQGAIGAAELAEIIALIGDGTISGKIAKDVFDKAWKSGRRPREIVEAEGLTQVTDSAAIEAACRDAVEKNPKQAEQYRAGQAKMLGYFVGQVMKATQGKANPAMVNDVLRKLLDNK